MNTGMQRMSRRALRWLLSTTLLLSMATVAQAATIVADFNGDGINDTATITAGSGTIKIVRGGGLGTGTYNMFSNWMTVHSVNTNGIAGQELVATFASGYVHVIDDRAKTSRGYNVFGINSVGSRLLFFSELNGAAGTEILFVYSKGHVAVVDDRLHVVRGYNVWGVGFGGPTRYFQIGDFNGVPGNELMFSYMSGTSEVVDDRLRAVRTYNYLSDGSAPTYANVDGAAGLEAIFKFHGSTIWLVDRTGALIYR